MKSLSTSSISIICLDKTVDDFLTNEGFSIPNIRYRIKNKIKRLFKN